MCNVSYLQQNIHASATASKTNPAIFYKTKKNVSKFTFWREIGKKEIASDKHTANNETLSNDKKFKIFALNPNY